MLDVLLLVVVIWLIWRNGCCIKRRISGVMCHKCAHCNCKNCTVCKKKQTCPKCPEKEQSNECKCPPCVKYKCELREAFDEADEIRYTEGIDETVKVESAHPASDKKPKVVVEKPSITKNIKPTVTVKIPPPPPCNCPLCPKQIYDSAAYTYYPIYQPLPYGVRY